MKKQLVRRNNLKCGRYCFVIMLFFMLLATLIPAGSSLADRPLPSDIRKDHGYTVPDTQSLKTQVPSSDYWKKLGEQLKSNAPSDEVEKAKFIASEVAKELDKKGITPNTSIFGRMDAAVKYNKIDAGTCGYLNDALTEALKGAGFDKGQLHSVVGYKEGWRAYMSWVDVNTNHVAPVVVIDGVPYSFDLWTHGGSEGSFKNFENSAWNGIKTESWGDLMHKHQGYTTFSTDEGLTTKGFDDAQKDLIDKTKVNLKAIKIEVKDSFGKPIGNAHVTLTTEGAKYSGTTGTDGIASIKGIKPAKYAIHVAAEGFRKFTESTDLVPMREDMHTTTLEPIQSIVLARVKSGSIPISDVKIRMSSRSPENTDETGEAKFNEVNPGSYTLTAEASGFAEESKKITVKPKDEESAKIPVMVDFNLKPRVSVKITGATQAFVADTVELEAEVDVVDSIKPALKYAWRLAGDEHVLGASTVFKKIIAHAGTYLVNLVVYVERPDTKSTVRLGEAIHKMVVEDRKITVTLNGPDEAKVGDEATFKVKVKSLSKSDKEPGYGFVWSINNVKFGGNSETQSMKVNNQGRNVVRVVVWQAIGGQWQRAGDATHVFAAAGPDPAKGSISINGPYSIETGDKAELAAAVNDTNVPSSALFYSWIVNGKRFNYVNSITLPGSAPGTYHVIAELWMKYKPNPIKLAQTSHNVTVVKKGEQPDVIGNIISSLLGGNEKPGTTGPATIPQQKPDVKPPVGRSYTSQKLPADKFTINGTWNAVDSKGRFNGKMNLSQSGSGVNGSFQTPAGSIPVSGSISGNTVSVILTFGSPAIINQYMQDMRVSQAIGSITAKVTLNTGSNPNELQGTLYPWHVQWNDDGKTIIIKQKWQGGSTHPGNPPRPFTLRR